MTAKKALEIAKSKRQTKNTAKGCKFGEGETACPHAFWWKVLAA
jgi:hypothetical protein